MLDATKIVPEELVPLLPVGRLVLNRNPDNFFAETEQVAFCAAHVVPGIDFSNDPLLAGRIHSYIDTQITRLGGPNFHEIPINAPVAAMHNNQRDGLHRQAIHRGRVANPSRGIMKLEENKAIVRGYLTEVVNQGNMGAFERYFADDVVFNSAHELRRVLTGMVTLRTAFPDFQLSIDDQIAEGDRVMTRVTFSGTHLGPFGPMAATGRKIRYSGLAFDRIADGKVVEMWHVASPATMLEQIRLVLSSPQAK